MGHLDTIHPSTLDYLASWEGLLHRELTRRKFRKAFHGLELFMTSRDQITSKQTSSWQTDHSSSNHTSNSGLYEGWKAGVLIQRTCFQHPKSTTQTCSRWIFLSLTPILSAADSSRDKFLNRNRVIGFICHYLVVKKD